MNEIRDRAYAYISEHLEFYRKNYGHQTDKGAFAKNVADCIVMTNPYLAVVERDAELPALTYEEYMAIHSAWANSKETVENLLRRITLETCYKVRKEGWVKEEKR